eukprot:TRINITY_DN27740_c0_g1_i2.p1 TRINITY_DN27740_c0_g1~~TRINITY_DN27740_c0_g1_i2.p1  ORF type:complete len:165 (-),score=23.72 TRINITY_DN27740_c0_g1_i2:14-469(-)
MGAEESRPGYGPRRRDELTAAFDDLPCQAGVRKALREATSGRRSIRKELHQTDESACDPSASSSWHSRSRSCLRICPRRNLAADDVDGNVSLQQAVDELPCEAGLKKMMGGSGRPRHTRINSSPTALSSSEFWMNPHAEDDFLSTSHRPGR